jgi:hypothetical protein
MYLKRSRVTISKSPLRNNEIKAKIVHKYTLVSYFSDAEMGFVHKYLRDGAISLRSLSIIFDPSKKYSDSTKKQISKTVYSINRGKFIIFKTSDPYSMRKMELGMNPLGSMLVITVVV